MSCFSSKLELICIVLMAVRLTQEYEIDSGVCGIRRASGQSRIVNGTVSKAGNWPWMVLIAEDNSQTCGGTLISGEWILTVAHCFEKDLNAYKTIMGAYRIDASGPNALEVKIHVLICHKGFESYTFVDDICLIKLSKPVEFTDYIIPACLPPKDTTINVGDSCFVTGWGETLDTGSNAKLRQAEVFVLDTDECREWYGEDAISIPEKHFCAGYRQGGIDTCQGDSGGPLVHKEKSHSGQSAYVLRGMTSFGVGCAQKERPGVYLKVVDYIDWIEEKMKNFEDDDCASYQSKICGGNLIHNTTIRSPTVTELHTYPANSKCQWKILGPKGYIIKFTFICYFLLSSLNNQCGDYVSITDDATGSNKTFCGNELPEPYTVYNNIAILYFESNKRNEYPGFIVRVQIISSTPKTSPEPPGPKTSATKPVEFASTSGCKCIRISATLSFLAPILVAISKKT